jgi:hypothetical protein
VTIGGREKEEPVIQRSHDNSLASFEELQSHREHNTLHQSPGAFSIDTQSVKEEEESEGRQT